MTGQRYALIVLVALVLAPAALGQTSLTPEAGVLVLRNGQVIAGEVTRAGDYYVVTLGPSGEIRLPAADVEAFCGSLDEAYEFKQRHLSGPGAQPHLNLADWCLRHNLYARCAEQLVAARQVEPDNARLLQLQRRLELAVLEPPAAAEKIPSTTATVSAEQLEKALQALPKGSVEKFSAIVQPILLNRCGANQCHGPNAKSEFRLLRPPTGQIASRRFTQRNLYATLRYLDESSPAASPLLTMPQRRHGSALTAVFDKHTQSQLSELTAWVKLTIAAPPPASLPTIGRNTATLSQPAASVAPLPAGEIHAGQSPDTKGELSNSAKIKAMRPAVASQSSQGAPFVPRDRFDPEIFNRQYHK
jgi:hypothetical protein